MKIRNGFSVLCLIFIIAMISGCVSPEKGIPKLVSSPCERINPDCENIKPHTSCELFALVIGINETNIQFLDRNHHRLRKAVSEAERMKNILKKSCYEVTMLTDKDATAENIIAEIKKISERKGRNQILIYYSGHGTNYYSNINENSDNDKELVALVKSINKQIEERMKEEQERCTEKWDEHSDKGRLENSFYIIPYQKNETGSGKVTTVNKLVSGDEIAQILSESEAAEEILILDACMAYQNYDSPPLLPVPVYSYELKREGFFCISFYKGEEEKNRDGEFGSILLNGLSGAADNSGLNTGGCDGIVSVFELINYIDSKWNDEGGPIDQGRRNRAKYIIHGCGDVPLVCYGNKK